MILLLLPLLTDHVVVAAAAHLVQVLPDLRPPVVFSNDSGSGSGELALLLAGPVSGSALYAAVYRYYRNADKTHRFESETLIALKDRITGQEEKVDEIRGTRDRRIRGDNATDFRSRVGRLD